MVGMEGAGPLGPQRRSHWEPSCMSLGGGLSRPSDVTLGRPPTTNNRGSKGSALSEVPRSRAPWLGLGRSPCLCL